MSSFGGTVKLKGESSYRKALRAITANLKEVSSQLKLQTAAYDKNEKSASKLTAEQDALNKRIAESKERIKVLKTALADAKEETGENSATTQKWQTQLNNAEAELVSLNKKLDDNISEQKKLAAEEEKSKSALGTLTSTISSQEKELEKLKEEYKNMTLEEKSSEKEKQNLATRIKKLSSELKDNKKKLEGAERATADLTDETERSASAAGKAANGGFTVLKGIISNLASRVISSAISKIKEFTKAAINAGMSFESSMSQVEAISGATGDDLAALTKKAKEMGAKTKYTASESADAFNYMAMAGWKTEDMLNGIEGVMNLAAASGEDLATTSDIVTDALTAMGYSAGDAGRLADVMAAASANANTNVGLMGATFQYAAPIVGSLGYTMEDTAVAIGLMANSGIKGTKAGTALRSIMTRLSTDAGASSKSLGALGTLTEKLGVQFYDAEGKTRPLNKVLGEAREKWKGLSAEQQTSYGKIIAGTNALSGWLSLMNAAPADISKLTKAVKSSDGAASKMADTMQNNVAGTMTKLKSQIEGVQIQIFEKLAPAFQQALKEASKFVKGINWNNVANAIRGALNKVMDGLKWLIKNAGLVTTALKVMVAAFAVKKVWDFTKSLSEGAKVLISYIANIASATAAKVANTTAEATNTAAKVAATAATGTLTAAQTALNGAMKSNPIGLVIGALGALVAIIGTVVSATNQQTDAEKKEQEQLEKTTEKIQSRKQALDDLETAKQTSLNAGMTELSHYETLYDELGKIVDKNGKVKDGYEERANFITSTLSEALDTEIKITDGVVKKYQELKDKMSELIEEKKAKIILDSQEEAYKAAIEGQTEATQALANAESDLAKKTAEADEKFLGFYGSATGNYINTYEELTNEIKKATEAEKNAGPDERDIQLAKWNLNSLKQKKQAYDDYLASYKKNYSDAEYTYYKYAYNIALYEENLAKFHAGKYSEMSKATWDFVKEHQGADDAERKTLEAQINTTSYHLKRLRALKKKYHTNMFDDEIKAAKKERKGYQDQLKQYLSDSEENVKGASVVWSSVLAKQLSAITGKEVEFKNAGKGNVQMMIDGVASGEPMSKKKMSQLVTKMIGKVTGKKGKAAEAGRNLINGLNDGITDDKILSKTYKNIEKFGKNLLKHLKDSLEEKSPSKATEEMGVFLVKGITVGTRKESKAAVKSLNDLGKQLIAALKANPSNAKNLGTSLVNKFSSHVESVVKQAKSKLKTSISQFVKAQSGDVKSLYSKFGEKIVEQFGASLEKATSGVTTRLNKKITSLTETMQKKVEEVNTKISNMKSKLSDYGELFSTVTSGSGYETVFLSDINSQISTLKQYEKNLKKLKGKVPKALMSEIVNMSVDDALKYTNALLALSKSQFKEYTTAYKSKQNLASNIANSFYADDLKAIKTNYTDKIKKELKKAKKEIEKIGKQTMQGFIKGMKSTKFSKELKGIANDIVNAMKKALGIHSPSTVFRDQIGKNIALGLGLGFGNKMKAVAKKMTDAVPTEFSSKLNLSGGEKSGESKTRSGGFYGTIKNHFDFSGVKISSDKDIDSIAHKVSDIFISDLTSKGVVFG